MRLLTCLVAVLGLVVPSFALAEELDDDFSRQELFSIIRSLHGEEPFSLPNNFTFPDDARAKSTFGVDFSHHNVDGCKCEFDWKDIAKHSVKFVYLKASQGAGYKDTAVVDNAIAIAKVGTLDMGVYHFLTATDDAAKQWAHFEKVLAKLPKMQLPPSLDLEWDAGPWRDDCPADAIIKIRTSENRIIRRCDKWGFVKSSDIVKMANLWIKNARAATGQEPVLYTAASWWNPRIAKSFAASGIDAKIVWIADYTSQGKLTENPKVPKGVTFTLWQFTDGANLPDVKRRHKIDASIFQGGQDAFRKAIGAH